VPGARRHSVRQVAGRHRLVACATHTRHADLKIPRVILRAGQHGDFSPRQLGREPLQAHVGETDCGHRAPQPHPRLATTGNAANRPSALSKARPLVAATFPTLAAVALTDVPLESLFPTRAEMEKNFDREELQFWWNGQTISSGDAVINKSRLLLCSVMPLFFMSCSPATKDEKMSDSADHEKNAAVSAVPAFDPSWEELPPDFESRLKFYSGDRHSRTKQFGIVGDPRIEGFFPQSRTRLATIKLSGSSKESLEFATVDGGVRQGRTWVGQNAFGAKTDVVEKIASAESYHIENLETFQCIQSEKVWLYDSFYIRSLVNGLGTGVGLRYLVVFTERGPSSNIGPFATGKPTLSNPVESKMEVTDIHCNVIAIWFFDPESRKIFRKLDLTQPTDWEAEVMRVALEGDGYAANWMAKHAFREKKGDIEELKWRRIAAAAGDPESQKVLTNYFGNSLSPDYSSDIALRDLRERVDHGDATAAITLYSINLKSLYATDEENERVARAFAAARADPRIQALVQSLRTNYQGARDERFLKIFSPLEKAQIEKERLEQMARMRTEAIFAAEEKRVATEARVLKYHQELAEKGTSYGQYSMGLRYLKGDGVEQDEKRAKEFFEKAAAQGDVDSQKELDKLKAK